MAMPRRTSRLALRLMAVAILALSGCVHAQVVEGLGGTGGAGGQIGFQTNVTPQLQLNGTCPQGTLYAPYTCTLTPTNGVGNVTCALLSGSLPSGLTANSNCTITGTPTPNAGLFPFVIQATDSASTPNTANASLSINIGCPPFSISSPPTLPPATQGSAYTFTFQGQGGVTPYSFTASGSSSPGLTFSAGVLSGTPTQAGTFTLPVTGSDSCNLGAQSDTVTFSLTVNSNIAVATTSLPAGTVSSPYSATLSPIGGTGPYAWSIISGSLPSGLTLSGASIAGTPTTAGTFPITVKVTDSLGNSATQVLTLVITCQPLAISTQSLPSCTAGNTYSFQMQASPAGFPPDAWTAPGLSSIGLSISSSGLITGTCSGSGTLNATITVQDSCPAGAQTQSGTFPITVNPAVPSLTIQTTSLPNATEGAAFSTPLAVSGGVPPYEWSVPGGTIPAGAIDILDWAMMPLPTRNQSHLSGNAYKAYHLDAGLMWWLKGSTGNPWDGEVYDGTYFYHWFTENGDASQQAACAAAGYSSCFVDPFAYKLFVTPVPVAPRYFVLGSSDVVIKSPSPNNFIRTTNCGTDAQPLINLGNIMGILHDDGVVSATPEGLTFGGSIGTTHVLILNYYWGIANETTVPPQSGTRERYFLSNKFGQFIWDTSSWNGTGWTINQTSLNNTVSSGGAATPNFGCKVPTIPITGGLPPGVLSTAHPQMNMADTTGVISGTGTTAGTSSFIVQVEDSAGTFAQQTLSLTVACPALALAPANGTVLPPATQNLAYSAQITGSGGIPALSYSATGLPAGMTLNSSTGALGGTPTTPGTYTIVVTLTDHCSATPQTLSYTYTLVVNAQLAITTPTLPGGTVGNLYGATVTAQGGITPYTFSCPVTCGLPGGLSINSSGAISGTPSASGSFTFTIQVADSASHTATMTYTISIAPSTAHGCGATASGAASTDNQNCGNYTGAPYEDLTTASPNTAPTPTGTGTLHTLSACTTIVPHAGDVWRFSANINDGASGTNPSCLLFGGQNSGAWTLDLAGFTLTGGFTANNSKGGVTASGLTIVNGTINCNIANGGATSCLTIDNTAALSQSILLTHLTVNNQNSPTTPDTAVVNSNTCQLGTGSTKVSQPYCGFEYAVYLENDAAASNSCTAGANQKTFNGACIEVAHSTINDTVGYTGAGYPSAGWCGRCTALYFAGNGGVTTEAWNLNIGNGNGYIDAHQGIVFFHTGVSNAHNNYFPWVTYHGTSDTGREILYDCAGKGFCNTGGLATNNQHEVYNNRAIRTRQVNDVIVSNSRFEHVASTVVDSAIMEGGNGDYAEKISGNQVNNNTFTMAGGNAIQAAESYGLTANANTFTCESNCSTGQLAYAWLAEGSNGLTFNIQSLTRTSACVVTMVFESGSSPTTTSPITGLYVNISGLTGGAADFNLSATAGNTVTTYTSTSRTVTYTQAGCSGANSFTYASGGYPIFWMSQSQTDAFAGSGSQIYVKNSTIDPLLTMPQPLVACGTASPACQNPPQTTLNGGQTQIKGCGNSNGSAVNAVGGTGALVTNLTGTCP